MNISFLDEKAQENVTGIHEYLIKINSNLMEMWCGGAADRFLFRSDNRLRRKRRAARISHKHEAWLVLLHFCRGEINALSALKIWISDYVQCGQLNKCPSSLRINIFLIQHRPEPPRYYSTFVLLQVLGRVNVHAAF